MTTYEELYSRVSHLVKAYRVDLEKYDREIIEHDPTCPFLHYTRDSGTHIIVMPSADSDHWPKAGEYIKYLFAYADRHHILRGVVDMAEYHVNPCNSFKGLVLHFDGLRFHEITATEALALAREYREQVEAEWRGVRKEMQRA